jgi:hypothetical protein
MEAGSLDGRAPLPLRRKSWFLVAPIAAAVSFGVFLVYRTGGVLDEGQA